MEAVTCSRRLSGGTCIPSPQFHWSWHREAFGTLQQGPGGIALSPRCVRVLEGGRENSVYILYNTWKWPTICHSFAVNHTCIKQLPHVPAFCIRSSTWRNWWSSYLQMQWGGMWQPFQKALRNKNESATMLLVSQHNMTFFFEGKWWPAAMDNISVSRAFSLLCILEAYNSDTLSGEHTVFNGLCPDSPESSHQNLTY